MPRTSERKEKRWRRRSFTRGYGENKTVAKDISTTMKYYVRAKEEAKRRAIEGVSLGRIIGEGS
jgi:hypothetical protein